MIGRTHFPWQLLAVGLAASASGIFWFFRLPKRQLLRELDTQHSARENEADE
jgi:hypothetical protein